jgi:hypothetical protein
VPKEDDVKYNTADTGAKETTLDDVSTEVTLQTVAGRLQSTVGGESVADLLEAETEGFGNTVAPTVVAMNGSSVRTGPLAVGKYILWSDLGVRFLAGDNTVVATSASIPLAADGYWLHRVTGATDNYIAAIGTAAIELDIIPVS